MNPTKPVQYFSDEYLKQCKNTTADQILSFLDSYRLLSVEPGKLQQINMRVPKNLLIAFKARAKREGVPYQLKLRELIADWAMQSTE